MAYTTRTGPNVTSLGTFDTAAELISTHPASLYNPGTQAYTLDSGWMTSTGLRWITMEEGAQVNANSIGRYNLGICGDSISANGFSNAGGNTPSLTGEGWAAMAPAMAGVICNPVQYATTGLTTATWISTWLATVIAAAPPAVTLMLGTNDVLNSVALATTQANLTTIFQALQAAGIYVISISLPPNSTNAASAKGVININNWVRAYWTGHVGGEYVDAYSLLMDSSVVVGSFSPYKSNYSLDGTHPTSLGGYYISYALYPTLQRLYPSYQLVNSLHDVNANNTASNQYLTGPLFQGTSGNKNGSGSAEVATGWNLTTSPGVVDVTGSFGTANSGIGRKQILTVTATGAGNFNIASDSFSASFANGDTIRAAARIKVVSCSGMTRLFWGHFSQNGDAVRWGETGQTAVYPSAMQPFLVAMTKGQAYNGGGSGYAQALLQGYFNAGGAAVIEIEQAEVRKNY